MIRPQVLNLITLLQLVF